MAAQPGAGAAVSGLAVERPTFRLTPTTAALLSFGALAWAGVVAYARRMGNGPGTMGLSVWAFLAMWAAMMAAMMVPSVAPVASLYSRTIRTGGKGRTARVAGFVGGYLAVWAATGLPAYGMLRLVDDVSGGSLSTMRVIASVALLTAGAYQLSPMKARCLRHCRSPLAQLLQYGNVKGPAKEMKVSLHHAAYCLGCCWALMALFVAFGVMNPWAMFGLAAVVLAEKVLRQGERIVQAAGVACLVLGVLVMASPSVAHAVVPSMTMSMPMGR